MIEYVNLEEASQICAYHQWQVQDYGILDAALARPRTNLYGQEMFPSLHLKGAALIDSVNRQHPLLDGNKRLSWIATAFFYRKNGLDLDATIDDAEKYVLTIAGEHMRLEDSALWLADRSRPA